MLDNNSPVNNKEYKTTNQQQQRQQTFFMTMIQQKTYCACIKLIKQNLTEFYWKTNTIGFLVHFLTGVQLFLCNLKGWDLSLWQMRWHASKKTVAQKFVQ